ncbi:MAG: DNA circularization protein [Planctomycetota bacterium]|jgi:prophage DNA circulation protein
MSWRDSLRPASFRGVPFFTQAAERGGGKRGQLHQYPGRDEPYFEELGRQARRFTVEAYLLGADVFEQRDRLEEALEKPGPAELVEHFRGTVRVQVLSYRTRHSTREGGMCRLSIECVEPGRNAAPVAMADTAGQVRSQADALAGTLGAAFGSGFVTNGVPTFIAAAAQSLTEAASDVLLAAADTVEASDGVALADYQRAAAALGATAGTGIRDPEQLAADVTALVGDLGDLSTSARKTVATLLDLADFGESLPTVPETTPSRRIEARNQELLTGLVRRVAAAEATRAAAGIEFDSYQEARAMRDRITERLELEMLAAGDEGDDLAHDELRKLYATLAADMQERSANLARLVSFTPPATLPSVVLAYRLYADATLEADIVARNRVAHPGFVPGGVALEVLSDA